MNLNEIMKSAGKNKKAKRKGRGHGSGMGKTSSRGHKGYHSRAGSGVIGGFEGGQNPQIRRAPKRGFNNYRFARVVEIVNLGDLGVFAEGSEVTAAALAEKGLIRSADSTVKLLGDGDAAKLTVKLHLASKSAVEKLTAAGGSFEKL